MQLTDDQRQRLARIGWREDSPAAQGLRTIDSGRLARVTEQHRSGYRVADADSEFAVQVPADWLRPRTDPETRAAVGDWVVVGADGVIAHRLPRHSLLKRGAAGEHYQQQLIAANLDTVFVVCGLDEDFNLRRIERYLVVVQGSGAEPVVVLTKADKCEDTDAYTGALADLAARGIAVHTVNAKDRASVAVLDGYLGPGRTAVLVGSSGAGKSTLTNTLLGIQKQKTRSVRESDSRGRHTTTHRALVPLPTGGCLIDTPGMRELKLTGEEDLAASVFDDIEALAGRCRFNDCRHEREPGCAVRAAVEAGAIDPERWAGYRKLQAELASASSNLEARRANKATERVQGKALNKRLDEKYGRH